MIITLVGSGESLDTLRTSVERALHELAIDDAVTLKITDDPAYKMELGITEHPALAIEEESIDFQDLIFQGEIPEYDEIRSMFISILGDDESDSLGCACGSGSCDDCSGTCSL